MLTNPTIDHLNALKLTGMVKAFKEQLSSDSYESMTFEERLGLLVDMETTERESRRFKTSLKQAKFRQTAYMEDLDYSKRRGLNKSLMNSLHSSKWIKEGTNILISGPTGVGKSYLACALGQRACVNGIKTRYFRSTRLFEDLRLARGDGRYPKLIQTLAKTHLLIIDDWGLTKLGERESQDLLEVLEDRHQIHSTIIASQLPVEHWHEAISNPTLADAILDRLIHHAHKIALDGDSMRKKKKSPKATNLNQGEN
ncbi:ATP-binding protein [Candidatus Peregrinibacteria bacterium]|jgi:DNA replication protein DnaC|nr:ATP-binding protein [Candidatus Peregrinibacteria bacterium]